MDVILLADDDQVVRLKLLRRIAHETTRPELALIQRHLGPDGFRRNALLSMEEVMSVDSICLGWLATVHKRFAEKGGKLVLHSIRPEVMDLLETARFELVFHIAEDEAAAMKMVRDGG